MQLDTTHSLDKNSSPNCQILFKRRKIHFSLLFQFENILSLTVGEKRETVISLSPKSFCFTNSHPRARRAECMVLFVAELHKNVSSTNSEDSKWSQKFILLLSRAVTLILSRQPVVTSLRSKEIILLTFLLEFFGF